MLNIVRFPHHLKTKPFYTFSFMIFFWCVFDAIISYSAPLLMSGKGFSDGQLGLIIGFSSVAGAGFDILINRFMDGFPWKKFHLYMFIICAAAPIILWSANGILLFLLAMALWGLYYDFLNFGIFDFISKEGTKEDHSRQFGFIESFKALGYFLGPLIAGLSLNFISNSEPLILSYVFLSLAFIFFSFLIKDTFLAIPASAHKNSSISSGRIGFKKELLLWKKLGRKLYPVLTFLTLWFVVESSFWTIGPLFTKILSRQHAFGHLFMAAHTLPPLFVGFFVGTLCKNFGKKNTAFHSFLLAALFLIIYRFLGSPSLILINTLVLSSFFAVSLPSIRSAFADYISGAGMLETEIEALEDFSVNIGYIIGPVSAGLLASKFGFIGAFSIIGILGTIVVIILMFVTPRKISIVSP